ncbi:MAG: cupredoxin domain-containing protein [Patescibacteria group bacterium]
MNRTVLVVIIIVLVAVGVWFFSRGNRLGSPEPVNVARPAGSEAVVTYTDSGYSPAEVRVKAGTKVIFENQSADLMWPASAVHPTHLELPGFDALSGVATGQSYAFTFSQAGTWRYHNHLRPTHSGTVIVE